MLNQVKVEYPLKQGLKHNSLYSSALYSSGLK